MEIRINKRDNHATTPHMKIHNNNSSFEYFKMSDALPVGLRTKIDTQNGKSGKKCVVSHGKYKQINYL